MEPDAILEMSDEEIMNMQSPPSEQPEVEKEPAEEPVEQEPEVEVEPEPEEEEPSGSEEPVESLQEETPPVVEDKAEAEPEKVEAKVTESAPNYEEFYKKVMAPFKANGRTVELKSPEEALQLMQMGANFTRKMQALAPHRKILTMLENNGLLDEGKLSYLIDLDKKNPDAIHKLMKESGVDPLSIDTDKEVSYQEGRHQVTDTEVAFRAVLDNLSETPDGQQTLQIINGSWDQPSKEILWENPEVMASIHEQRESGVYAKIVAEIDRQKLLGTIPAGTPFLHAYKQVGDALVAQRVQNPVVAPVATRVVAPKPAVKNSDKASAAANGSTSSKSVGTAINPLAMSDDEFLLQMQNRL